MIRQAVILVGGLGTRLGALTSDTPKPALPVGGKPFIAWLLEDLARWGIEETILLAGFQAAKMAAAAAGFANVTVVAEPTPLGTGGALRFASDRLDDWFFLINGDSVLDINPWDLAQLGRAPNLAGLALRRVEDASRYGAAILDGDRITTFAERSPTPGPGLINGGVGVLAKALVERIAPGAPVSIEREIYPGLAADGLLAGRRYDAPFIDIGAPEDFARAQSLIPALFRRGAVIFDRDGVLNRDVGYAHRPDQIVWTADAFAAVKAVNDAGLFAFVATNQAGVARGYYGEEDVQALHRWMEAELRAAGAHIDAFVYSPFHPEGAVEAYRAATECRKPGPGMIRDLMARFPVDPARTVMIGDKPTDTAAAAAAGVAGEMFDGGNLLDLVEGVVNRLAVGRFRRNRISRSDWLL